MMKKLKTVYMKMRNQLDQVSGVSIDKISTMFLIGKENVDVSLFTYALHLHEIVKLYEMFL